MNSATSAAPSGEAGGWIRDARWDSVWLIGSAVLVPLVLIAVWAGTPAPIIGVGVTAIIGGPHLFSTFAATYLDGRFRRAHGAMLIALVATIPALVAYMVVHHFQVMLSVFIFAASLHVLQQNAYIAEMYRARGGRRDGRLARLIDHSVLMLSFYPVASYKLVRGTFVLGDVEILIPSFAKIPLTYWTIGALFAVAAVAFVGKTILEWRRGELQRGRVTLIAVTTTIAFLTPLTASGARLELAFQAVNAWHSFQYMALIALFLRVRTEAGLIESSRLTAVTRKASRFYGACLLTTLVLFASIMTLIRVDPLGLTANQYYYMGVLSCLLIHYALDGYLFTAAFLRDPADAPFATPFLDGARARPLAPELTPAE
ncbi:MAG: hypothetical protein HYV09_18005 [Deltaproteobacteria bacterium]|nr:hypothetical protein [Deltaproteobacteria bacterium]